MGRVKDEERALKRMKVSSTKLGGLSNGASVAEPLGVPFRNSMARSLASSENNDEVVGSKGVIRRVEFVRIIGKALYALGYQKSSAHLEEESGIHLHSSSVNMFMQHVLDGNWDESINTLHKLGISNDIIVKSASFLILEQKYLELLQSDKIMEALKTLRTEIAPISIDNNRILELSSLVVSHSLSDLIDSPCQNNLGAKSRENLLQELKNLLPPTVMVPGKRLENLVEQALLLQRDACVFHNSLNQEISLYTDHDCGRSQIPCQTLQVLQAHTDEIWFLQFSHNGKYLASSSMDLSAIIWEVNNHGVVSLKHRLCGHKTPVFMVSWSPDDCQLLTCGVEETIKRWDVCSGECLHVYEKAGLGLISCGWFPDGKCIVAGINDNSICVWDLDGKELECWKGQRILKISDLEITDDGKKIITICREAVILLLDREARVDRWVEEDEIITSFQLSRDNKFLLVNLLNQEIHLWNIVGQPNLVRKYKGHKRSRFIIRSCFGGLDEAFIASGSEDSKVYIWHRNSEPDQAIEALSGHSGSVNCVTWNPSNHHMLASASDDRTIRIWGLKPLNVKGANANANANGNCYGNGFRFCNGET